MLASELEGILNAHAFLRVERPPVLWETDVDLEAFIRALGEMIAAGLVRNGQELSEITLNVSNVTAAPDCEEVGQMKIGVVGAGGVGGYYGARLALAGSEVGLIALGDH